LPADDGFLIGAKLKQQTPTPVIMLAPEDSGEDHVFSATLGMDACLPKPLCMSKLTTYVKALLIKAQTQVVSFVPAAAQVVAPVQDTTQLEYRDLTICLNRRIALCKNADIQLTGKEFRMLTLLVEEQHRALSRSEMVDSIWGQGSPVNHRATDDIVKRLRKKIRMAGSGTTIHTVWGFGFRLGVV
jgi:DNA-binding response OmpR family regulator